MGFFDSLKKDSKSQSIRSNVTGRSCFDCEWHDASRDKGEQIYCKWDSEYYYPEAGRDCDDFRHF